jgi:hypothetical protein
MSKIISGVKRVIMNRKLIVIIGAAVVAFILLLSVNIVDQVWYNVNKEEINHSTNNSQQQQKLQYHLKAVEVMTRSLQAAAAIYVAQQGVSPTRFSDFVNLDGGTQGAYTLSLMPYKDTFDSPKNQQDLYDSKFLLDLKNSPVEVTYYLRGNTVVPDFSRIRK